MIETPIPNQERIEQLCLALESDAYGQTQNSLRRNDKYCCLGVACTLVDESRWYPIFDARPEGTFRFAAPGTDLNQHGYSKEFSGEDLPGETTYLPDDVIAWYGFESMDPRINARCICMTVGMTSGNPNCGSCGGRGRTRLRLSALNDAHRWSFKEIARALRETYLTSDGGTDV